MLSLSITQNSVQSISSKSTSSFKSISVLNFSPRIFCNKKSSKSFLAFSTNLNDKSCPILALAFRLQFLYLFNTVYQIIELIHSCQFKQLILNSITVIQNSMSSKIKIIYYSFEYCRINTHGHCNHSQIFPFPIKFFLKIRTSRCQ